MAGSGSFGETPTIADEAWLLVIAAKEVDTPARASALRGDELACADWCEVLGRANGALAGDASDADGLHAQPAVSTVIVYSACGWL